ncbi:MAG: hemolysin III family protein [Actinobacteria bacterium]|nr:hemolysin III family protein [Actinomycetota bacterium]MBI3685866.1 hemolysin III family protein [Actinomycetota bacterium]
MLTSTASGSLRPRLRGWLHAWAGLASVITGSSMVAVATATRGSRGATATGVYAVSLLLLFGISATYHRFNWAPRARRIWRRLDHSMIFIFIAGSYTPFALLVLPWPLGRAVLVVVWAGALAGVALKMAWPGAPRKLGVPLYLALGWVAVVVLKPLLHGAGVAALVLLLAGGLIYSLGAIVYAVRRPDPAPHFFGYHEVFHSFTIVAATCHYIAIWFAIFAR